MDAIQLDNPTLVLIALAILVIVVVWVLFRRNRGDLQVGVKGPGGTEASIKASTQSPPIPPAVNITDIGDAGNLRARDNTGRGANVQRVNKVEGDIDVTVTSPDNTPPKT